MAKKRKTKKHKKPMSETRAKVILLIMLIVTALLGMWLCVALFLRVETIEVRGKALDYSTEEIIDACGIEIGDSIFFLSAGANEHRLHEQFPYLEKISIVREYPTTVVIEIEETTAYAAIPHDGGTLLVSRTLKILDDQNHADYDVIKIYGLKPAEPKPGRYADGEDAALTASLNRIFEAVDSTGIYDKVTSVYLRDSLNLYLVYDDRLVVSLGTANDLDYKLRMLAEVAENRLGPDESGTLDISIAGKAAFDDSEMKYPEGYFDLCW